MKASSFWNIVVPRAMTIYANMIFVVLWVGLAAALIVNQEWLDTLWSWVQALPPVPRFIVWILILPIMAGLWIGQSSWPTLVRVLGIASIAGWNLLAVSSFYKNFRQV